MIIHPRSRGMVKFVGIHPAGGTYGKALTVTGPGSRGIRGGLFSGRLCVPRGYQDLGGLLTWPSFR